MKTMEPKLISIPLGQAAHDLASQFAAEQNTPHKGKQVYLNTLAVYAVYQYLTWLQIETDLPQGDSWNAGLRSLLNTADLVIPGVGKLECCPVLPGATMVSLSAEASVDRIGYVPVQFSEILSEVQLLGFMSAAEDALESIRILDLAPLETVLDCLTPKTETEVQRESVFVNLGQWFQGVFEREWQSLGALLDIRPELSPAFSRSEPPNSRQVKGAKLIDLGVNLGHQSVVVLVAIAPDEAKGFSLLVQLHPAMGQHLPPNIKLILQTEAGMPLQEIQARGQDDYIQMRQFWGQTGETFRIQVSLNSVSVTEYFTL
jgi:hypothetical protein